MRLNALFRLGFPSATDLLVLNLATHRNSTAHFPRGTPSRLNAAPIACKHAVSGLFHSPPGVLFTFPSRYFFSIGRQMYLALDRGRSGFKRNFTCSALLGWHLWRVLLFAYGAITLFGRLSQHRSAKKYLCNSTMSLQQHDRAPTTPIAQRSQAYMQQV